MVAVSSLPLSFKVTELLPQIPGLVSDTQFPKFWGLVQATSAQSENREALGAVWHIHRCRPGGEHQFQVALQHPPFPLTVVCCSLHPGAGIIPLSTPSLPLVLQACFLPAQGTEKCWHCQKPCVHYDSPNIPLFLLFC